VSLGVICTICYSYGGLSETAIKPLYRIYFMQVRSSTGLLVRLRKKNAANLSYVQHNKIKGKATDLQT